MTNREIESKLQEESRDLAPDLLDAIQADCLQADRQRRKGSNHWIAWAGSITAALVLLLGGFGALQLVRANTAVANTITLDVNPSINITVNAKEKVIAVTPLNDDAKVVIGDMDFQGSSLDLAVNALLGSMLRHGYINSYANSILISVDGTDNGSEALQQKLMTEVDDLLAQGNIEASVLSQQIAESDDIVAIAEQYGISRGKAQLLHRIVAQNSFYTYDSLASLTIHELNLITESGDLQLDQVKSIGKANDEAYFPKDDAIQAALTDAGFTKDDVRKLKCKLDWEDGHMVYEVSFEADGYSYEYEINATTGGIEDSEREERGNNGSKKDRNENKNYIEESVAKSTALKHAGLTEKDISNFSCELGREKGVALYTITFTAGDTQYTYHVHAVSGKIMKHKADKAGQHDQAHKAPAKEQSGKKDKSSPITKEEATAAALKYLGMENEKEAKVKASLRNSMTAPRYVVTVQIKNQKQTVEVDAITGKIIEEEQKSVTEEDAMQTALTHLGATQETVQQLKIKLRNSKTTPYYEITFRFDGNKYEYQISAKDGTILEVKQQTNSAGKTQNKKQ